MIKKQMDDQKRRQQQQSHVRGLVGDSTQFAVDVANIASHRIVQSSGQETIREVECIGDCSSVGKFVSEDPSGGIIDSVGDVIGGAFSAVGDVLSSIAD